MPDPAWSGLLAHPKLEKSSAATVHVCLPSTESAEAILCDILGNLAQAMETPEAFYRKCGWGSPDELFAALGELVVMIVDVDHNDSDDRLAIIILAYQIASANAERRQTRPDATCTVLLDVRTYESSGICVWRTAALSARLQQALASSGLRVQMVLAEPQQAIEDLTDYLRIDSQGMDQLVSGTGHMLTHSRRSLCDWAGQPPYWGSSLVSIWVLGGLCAKQVADLEEAVHSSGVQLAVFEQAQPGANLLHFEMTVALGYYCGVCSVAEYACCTGRDSAARLGPRETCSPRLWCRAVQCALQRKPV